MVNYFHVFCLSIRDFHLYLTTGTTVLAENFKAYLVYEKGRTSQFFIDQSKIFSGYLMGM